MYQIPVLRDQFDDVIVAEVDATANDTPSGFAYTGFPTMFWVPKGSTEPIKYDSGRDKASMKAYIEEKLSANADSHDEL